MFMYVFAVTTVSATTTAGTTSTSAQTTATESSTTTAGTTTVSETCKNEMEMKDAPVTPSSTADDSEPAQTVASPDSQVTFSTDDTNPTLNVTVTTDATDAYIDSVIVEATPTGSTVQVVVYDKNDDEVRLTHITQFIRMLVHINMNKCKKYNNSDLFTSRSFSMGV